MKYNVAENIKYAMRVRGISPKEMAAACLLSIDQWYYRMRDPYERMELMTLERAAKKLDTTAAWLLSENPPRRW